MGVKIGKRVRNFWMLLLSLAIHGGMLGFLVPKEPRSTQPSQPKPIDSVNIVTLPPTPKAIESPPQTETSNLISPDNTVSQIDQTSSSEHSQLEPQSEFPETGLFEIDQSSEAESISTQSPSEGVKPETAKIDRSSADESTQSELPEKETIEENHNLDKKTPLKRVIQKTDEVQQVEWKTASQDFQSLLTQIFESEEGLGQEQPLRDVLQFAGNREDLLVSLFCDDREEKKPEIIDFRWFSDREPELVFQESIEPTLKNFQLQKLTQYANGDVYKISKSGLIRYLNIAPLADGNGTLVTIWTQPPRSNLDD
jgi:hypothetical protein